MADYISRDYTVENMENYPWDTEHDKNAAIHLVRELVPAADVRPVVRGEWIEDDYGFVRCSNCGMEWDEPEHPKTNYCPSCGAKMQKELTYAESV